MNEIREWSFEGAAVRTLEIDGEPWFIGKDVAERLGYCNTRDALSKHVDTEDKNTVAIHDGIGNPNKVIINESGVYALIFGSKLESAKRFKRWVTAEVLPAIRRTGKYEMKPDSYMIDDRRLRAQRWLEETEEWQRQLDDKQDIINAQQDALNKRNRRHDTMNAIMGDRPVTVSSFCRIAQLAGFDVSIPKMFRWMHEHEWLTRGGAHGEENLPHPRFEGCGFFTVKETTIHADGSVMVRKTPMLTKAGQDALLEALCMERDGEMELQDWHRSKPATTITIKIKTR